MIWTLIRKEMLDQILSIRFSISLILACVFLVPATYILAEDYGWLDKERGPFMKEGFYPRKSWYYLNRRLPSVGVLATGLDQELSLSCQNEGLGAGPLFHNRTFVHNPNRYFFSSLDFVFFVSIVGSLMAFAFTYDAISGEKQRGTLRLTMTQPIARPLFLLSKFLGSYISFAISIAPALMGVIVVLVLHPDVDLRASEWGAAGFLLLLALLYLSGFFMLGLFVSCVTKTPKTTLTALLTLWTILVLVIPNFSPFLASKLRPIRSLHEVEATIAAMRRDYREPTRQKEEDFIQQHGGNWETLNEAEKETIGKMWDEYGRQTMKLRTTGEAAKIRIAFLNEVETQAKMGETLSLISPAAAFIFLASDIAQTGLESERDYRRAVFRYRRQYGEYQDRQIEETGDYGSAFHAANADTAPPFVYRAISLSQAVGAYIPQFMVLVLYSILFFFAAQIAFIRAPL